MISTSERHEDIIKIISKLDITPTMYKNAEAKYKALAAFLVDKGIDAEIYPQGSFALGTVVRPSAKLGNANYDLDFICQINCTRDEISPSELRNTIEQALSSSNLYGGKLNKYGECFTVEYSDVNGVGFSIDIVPATDESILQKNNLIMLNCDAKLVSTAIAIPRQEGEHTYHWITNNPRGFKEWFDEINRPFLECGRSERLASIFADNRSLFESVDDIPLALERSSMQRVIQILKYHRDNYYSNLRRTDKDEIKPISAIINTLVAEISKSYQPTNDVFALLSHVLNELIIYSRQQNMRYEDFLHTYSNRTTLLCKNGKWELKNPANPSDNFADKWNHNPEISKFFFNWISVCKKDLVDSMALPDNQFYTEMTNAFGSDIILQNFGNKYNFPNPKPFSSTSASKPYKKYDD